MTFTPLPMPQIETERLILRGWQESDYDGLLEIFTDEDASRYIGGVKTDWQTWRHLASFFGHWHLRGYTPFAIERKTDGKMIGYTGPWYPGGWPEPEIAYSLIPTAQGQGFASEAASAALQFSYETLGWETAVSVIYKDNLGSKGVAQKLGARFEENTILFDTHPAEIWRYPPPQEFIKKFAKTAPD